jgi:hypothetical protein
MNMQDNELDQLFRSKLEGLEEQPGAHVWNNITTELGGNKKRALVPMLRIAASVVVVLAAGAWFMMKKDRAPVNVTGSRVAQSHIKTKPAQMTGAPKAKAHTTVGTMVQPNVNSVAQLAGIKTKTIRKKTVAVAQSPVNIDQPVTDPVTPQPEQVLAVAPADPVKTQAVLPDVPLSVKTIEAEQVAVKPVNTTAAVAENQPTKKSVKKHGIRSFGDLINVVVAKVDKREDKLIEFSNTDDDEATITGVNLGIIKVKKEK